MGGAQLWAVTPSGQILNQASRLALDVQGARTVPGAAVIQWPAKGTGTDRLTQLWRLTRDGRIESLLDQRLVLGISTPARGAPVVLEPKGPGPPPRQCWRLLRSVLPRPDRFFIEHVASRRRLTPRNGAVTEGTPLAVEPASVDHPGTQVWAWTGHGPLVNDASGLVADVKDEWPVPGEVILSRGKDGGDIQPSRGWNHSGDGRIRSGLGTAWALSTNSGANQGIVQLAPAADTSRQQWRVRRAVFPSRCLTFTLGAGGRLTGPVLRVQADFQTDGSRLVLPVDRQAHAAWRR